MKRTTQNKKHFFFISGLLTLAITAVVIGSFFAIQSRSGKGTPIFDGTVEVTEEILTAASMDHSAWIRDGKLFIAGEPFENQEAVSDWKRLVQVAVSDDHLAALDHTGQVYAIGSNRCQQCEVDAHQFVVNIAAGMNCTIAVLVSGEVLVYGVLDAEERQGLESEKNARKVVLCEDHTAVLRKDGTVAAYGDNGSGQCNVSGWKDVEDLGVGRGFTVGVTTDGSVLYAGADTFGQAEAANWKKIRKIAAGTDHVVGIKKDGTAIAAGKNTQSECGVEEWKGLVSVAAGFDHTIGMDESGGFFAVGYNGSGQCDVSGL